MIASTEQFAAVGSETAGTVASGATASAGDTTAMPKTAATLSDLLLQSIARTRAVLERVGMPAASDEKSADTTPSALSPLGKLVSRFDLSTFEVNVLVLCAAVELDPTLPSVLEASPYSPGMRHPTFQLLLNVLPEAHWSTLMPQSPLRRWRLVDVMPGESLTNAPLRVQEGVLHFLMSGSATDERLQDLLREVKPLGALPQSYRYPAEQLLQAWSGRKSNIAPVRLTGSALDGKAAMAAAICASLGFGLRRLAANSLPERAEAREEFARLLERDSTLNSYGIFVDAEKAEGTALASVIYLAERFQGLLMVASSGSAAMRPDLFTTITIDKPPLAEQEALWRFALGEPGEALNGELTRLARQFPLDVTVILHSAERVLREREQSGGDLNALLWEACRSGARTAMESLATRIERRAQWKEIVLPEGCLEALRTIVYQMKHKHAVISQWEAAGQTSRGLGTAALFCGPSGTGKTLAAEILATELSLDLFHVDLSHVVSKYIGETEKNLRTIFDAAEDAGAILLFDEADALFGKRSEVRDSHDRYANIEVSYLLQRMEAYRGLAILTTNQRAALDTAFLRRIRFVVHFPYPDSSLRRQIWERVFRPGEAGTPTDKLDFDKLARLNVPGGNIRNIALNASYIAAECGEPVRMRHLLAAARQECSKLERSWNDAELGGWA